MLPEKECSKNELQQPAACGHVCSSMRTLDMFSSMSGSTPDAACADKEKLACSMRTHMQWYEDTSIALDAQLPYIIYADAYITV